MQDTISNQSAVVALRRDFHRHPELGFLEYRTAALTAERLVALGWAVRAGPEVMRADAMLGRPTEAAVATAQRAAIEAGAPAAWVDRMPGGQTGVVAELRRGDGPVLAFRFDMDALPVIETDAPGHPPNRDGYQSASPGVMHACGHDGHTAIGLAVAERLAHPAAGWRGTIRLVFQPAEEGGRGAAPMVEAGALDGVDWFFAGHLGCALPTGKVAAQATGILCSTKLDATFHGRAAHAGMAPQEGRNALLAGAAAALGLHGIARHGSDATMVNVGRMVAGSGRNVVPDRCDMQLEVRGSTNAALAYMEARAHEVLAAAAAMHGCTHETIMAGRSAVAVQSPEAVALVARVAAATPGTEEVLPSWALGGGEDATFMMQRVQDGGGQAAYFIIGSDIPSVHHAVDFDVDERALEHGVRLFAGLAEAVLGGRA